MAFRLQIMCVNKQPRSDPHERISHIGGTHEDGSKWKITLDWAIAGIEEGKWTLFTSVDERSPDVVIATHKGHKYLKTTADGVQPDNLLSLPECT
jgi:hypothetical protein